MTRMTERSPAGKGSRSFGSRGTAHVTDGVMSAMRYQLGGYAEKVIAR
jgi:6-phosphogluconate dehydrogenase (decarboxylating)